MPAQFLSNLLKGLLNKRGAILLVLIAYPFAHMAILLGTYYDVRESLPKFLALCFSAEYLSPLLYGVVPVLLILLVDSSRGRAQTGMRLLSTITILGMGLIRAIQTSSVVQSRYFLTRVALAHMDEAEFVITPQNMIIVAACLIPPAIAVWLIWTLRSRDPVKLSPATAVSASVVFLTMFLLALGVGNYHRFYLRYSNDYGVSRSPETALFKMLFGSSKFSERSQETLGPETLARLHEFGIDIDVEAPLPFRKSRIFQEEDGLPWPPFETAPDIVLVFAESLSADLLGCYGSQWPGITPNMDAFAGQSMMFTNYYNHTTPTITSLHGTLCSTYEVLGHSFWDSEEAVVLRTADMLSIAQALRNEGYETTYLGCGPRLWSHFEEIMQHLGFEHTLFVEHLEEMFPEIVAKVSDRRHQKNLPDEVMFNILREIVEKPSDRPTFTVMTTVGTHFPYDFDEGTTYGDGKSIFLNAVRGLDAAFAKVANLASERKGDRELVFILTGDHAMFPTREHVEIRGPEYRRGYYDRLTLLIQRSGHMVNQKIDTLGSSVDLVPTLLHLLGINIPNPFMGDSIFGRRRDFPVVVGSQEDYLFFKTPQQEDLFRSDSIEQWGGARASGGAELGPGDLEKWLAYIRYAMLENRIWKN